MLKSEEEQLSLSALDEIHLLVSLCASVFPQVPKSELVRHRLSVLLVLLDAERSVGLRQLWVW